MSVRGGGLAPGGAPSPCRRQRLRRLRSLSRAAAGYAAFWVGGSAPDTPGPVGERVDHA